MPPVFVVLSDLSAAAEAALTYATRLAQLVQGKLVLLHIFQDPYLEPEGMLVAAPAVLASHQQVHARLLERARQLPVPNEVEVSVEPLSITIADVVQRHQPLLLVLGRGHADTFPDQFLPHQTGPILHAAAYPMLLVPEDCATLAPPQRVVVAADEQPFWLTPPALALADLLAALQLTTTVVHVAPQVGPCRADLGLQAVARTALFGPLTYNSLYEVCEEARVEGILHAARELEAELVAVMARPHTFLGGLFHRSVTAQLLRRSPQPVLVLPTTA